MVIDRSGLATVYNSDRKQVLQFPVSPNEQGTVDPRCVAVDKEDRIYIGKHIGLWKWLQMLKFMGMLQIFSPVLLSFVVTLLLCTVKRISKDCS